MPLVNFLNYRNGAGLPGGGAEDRFGRFAVIPEGSLVSGWPGYGCTQQCADKQDERGSMRMERLPTAAGLPMENFHIGPAGTPFSCRPTAGPAMAPDQVSSNGYASHAADDCENDSGADMGFPQQL